MVVSNDFPPPPRTVKDSKRRSKRRVRSKELEELISSVTRAAHVARNKGFYMVSPEAIQCVELLRHLRSLPLTPRLLIKTNAFRSLLFLSTNGNPKIRSESRSVVAHWKTILANN